MEDKNLDSAHVLVSGNVQGVFFRDSTRQKAEALGLTGWVKNNRDGRVEAYFEGPSDKVREMVRWCREGPSHADVANVEADYGEPREHLERFEVR